MKILTKKLRIAGFKQANPLPEDFDAQAYLELNPDVAKSSMSAEDHFRLHGRRESRPHTLDDLIKARVPIDFDNEAYLLLNPDVKASGQSATQHYARYGAAEKRSYRFELQTHSADDDSSGDLPEDFNESLYLELNPDVRQFTGSPREHYLIFGREEGRKYNIDPSKFFQTRSVRTYDSFPYDGAITYENSAPISGSSPKVIAFYLPQYHRVKENDEWWGEGFTEWTNVKKALPNFVGHNQPRVPLNNNYYDLEDIENQHKQAALAETFGIDAFCYYMYWFNGRRVLEKPLDQLLANKSINKKFCVCWANENWTRTWDGNEKDVLLEQVHTPDSDRRFIKDTIKYLSDPRYYKIDGKLVLLVYRVDLIPDCVQTAAIWRDEVRKAGLGELHLCAVQFYGISDPTPWGFDAAVEFPPHGWLDQRNLPDQQPEITMNNFSGHVFDYEKSIQHALSKPYPNYTWYRGVFPGWDNTARRQLTPHIFHGNNPHLFKQWLTEVLRQQTIMAKPEHQVVFINAWNEWGEGAHLEPDELHKYGNLQAVSEALSDVKKESEILNVLRRLRSANDSGSRADDERSLMNIIKGYERTVRHLMSQLRDNK